MVRSDDKPHRPKAEPLTKTYSILNVDRTGKIDVIVGVPEQQATRTIVRSRCDKRFGFVVLGSKTTFLTRRQAVAAGRLKLKAQAAKYTLDAEIARLQQVRVLLASSSASKRRGRPPASAVPFKPVKQRTMSAAGRKRIAEAQRKRWAAQKATARKKAA